MMSISRCPGTLREGFSAYSSSCKRRVFFNKRVSHILPYHSPHHSEEEHELFLENRKRVSISGVQEKLSLTLEKNKLRLTDKGEQGLYILKPIPRDLKMADQLPANEHLTMQIASQIFGINTAANALIFFRSGEPAYITKRFDIKGGQSKWGVEDLASLAGRSRLTHGEDFKYADISYQDVAELIKKYVGAYQIEIEKYFQLIIFNFLFSNGDAHLKNFSLMETTEGDYILSPAYDLLNTRLHVSDTYFAFKKGLFSEGSIAIPKKKDFLHFAEVIGVNKNRAKNIYLKMTDSSDKVHAMIQRSFLSEKAKKGYLIDYNTRRNLLI